MILYVVRSGIIEVKSVVRETRTGWREHNNGFINRHSYTYMGCITGYYYTTSLEEAKQWRADIVARMNELLQISQSSESDVDFWVDGGSDEQSLPKPRRVNYKDRFNGN